MSEELDDVLTYDVLFDGLWDETKGLFYSLFAQVFAGARSEYMGEDTLEVTMPVPGGKDHPAYDKHQRPRFGSIALAHPRE